MGIFLVYEFTPDLGPFDRRTTPLLATTSLRRASGFVAERLVEFRALAPGPPNECELKNIALGWARRADHLEALEFRDLPGGVLEARWCLQYHSYLLQNGHRAPYYPQVWDLVVLATNGPELRDIDGLE